MRSIKSMLMSAINDIKEGRNFDVYVIEAIAVAIAILGFLGRVEQTIISSAILAALGLLANSLLQSRNESSAIKNLLGELSGDRCTANNFFRRYEINQFKDAIQGSQSAIFWGIHFRKTIPVWDFALQQALRNGARLRFLLVKPDSSASNMSLFRHNLNTSKDDIDRYLEGAIKQLAHIGMTTDAIDYMEVKVIDFLPPWTIVAINPSSSNGEMSILLSSFRTTTDISPAFQLMSERDENWFIFFVGQFEKAWKEAKSIELRQYTTHNKPSAAG